MLIQEIRTAVLNNSNAHATVNILRLIERVDRWDNSIQIVPANITNEGPYPRTISTSASDSPLTGITIQERLQYHCEELCLVQRYVNGTHI
jgi:hypothetical protein